MLAAEDKGAALAEAVAAVRDGRPSPVVYLVNPASFSQVPGSPFAYWVSEEVRGLFAKLPSFESEDRHVRIGLSTSDDFRFLRAWWEVRTDGTARSNAGAGSGDFDLGAQRTRRWVPFAKGGDFARYYADIHLLVNWESDGSEIKHWVVSNASDPGTVHWSRRIANSDHYFRSGLTWSLRTTSGISLRVLPGGCIFGHKGPAIFANQGQLLALLALTNTRAFEGLVSLQLGAAESAARSYEVGVLQKTPLPDLSDCQLQDELARSVVRCIHLAAYANSSSEVSHVFVLPACLRASGSTLAQRVEGWRSAGGQARRSASLERERIEEITFRAYRIEPVDRPALAGSLADREEEQSPEGQPSREDEPGAGGMVPDLLSYTVGSAFGRWDIRLATGERAAPEPPDPFAPLPACSPGMLTGDDGLPAREAPPGYPLRISWDGILADDPGENGAHPHQEDIARRVREALTVIWGERAEAIEQEACEILHIKDLREYFRKPAGFFLDHLKRYSKSRRQAPIYWPLSTASGSYTLWIYYHRLTDDLLHTAINKFVKPKIEGTERRLEDLLAPASGRQGPAAGTAAVQPTGREASKLRDALEETRNFLAELIEFRDELLHVINLPYKPDLNDGVLITAAPLRKLFRLPKWRKDLEECWRNLEAGDYDWAHLAYSIWPERVREKCKTDRSFAIAHGLEELCSTQRREGTKSRRKKKAESTQIEM